MIFLNRRTAISLIALVACGGGAAASPDSAALCDRTCMDGIALRSLRDAIKVVYNMRLSGNPVGAQDQMFDCLPSGTVHVHGTATSNADQGTTNVDLTYVLTQCKFSETYSDPTRTFSMTLTGTVTESGTIAVQPSSTTALQIKGSITFSGTVYWPAIMYSEPACTVAVGQNGNDLSGTTCGRVAGVAL
ncbi:MAG: hypothetical protein M3O46_06110 [Myxococcota bacterium]|nr:hypothetical protein [Myxococcota bacterium]